MAMALGRVPDERAKMVDISRGTNLKFLIETQGEINNLRRIE